MLGGKSLSARRINAAWFPVELFCHILPQQLLPGSHQHHCLAASPSAGLHPGAACIPILPVLICAASWVRCSCLLCLQLGKIQDIYPVVLGFSRLLSFIWPVVFVNASIPLTNLAEMQATHSKVTKGCNRPRWADRWTKWFCFFPKPCENISGGYWLLQLQAEILQWLKCLWSFIFISSVALSQGCSCACGKFITDFACR